MTEQQNDSRPAVTVFSGFLGAGKTTLVNHLLRNLDGVKLAIVVNDMGEINIDASLIREGSQQTQLPPGQVVELTDGCVCCSIQDDLSETLTMLCREGDYDAMLVECTGVAEPMSVVQSFYRPDPGGRRLAEIVRLDTMVTVVDSRFFLRHWERVQSGEQPPPENEQQRPLFELLVEQVECADVILLNKADLITEEEKERLQVMLRQLNQHAELIPTKQSEVETSKILLTNRFHPEKTLDGATWIQMLEEHEGEDAPAPEPVADPAKHDATHEHAHAHAHGHEHGHEHTHEHACADPDCDDPDHDHTPAYQAKYGLRSFVYEARRPFDTARFSAFWEKPFPGLLRAKGFAWIWDYCDMVGFVSVAGDASSCSFVGPWWATRLQQKEVKREEMPEGVQKIWQTPYGDRRQEIVMIGIGLDEKALRQQLEMCLMTPKELKRRIKLEKRQYLDVGQGA